ncbi:MAG: type I DNA topoisomerase, partial [Lentisphaeria bacterium]|nr:type I DNA topoisomerase [Lentisphaeria bacterium]
MASAATKLVIVESPTKVKTISKILGSNYVVKASMGHVRDLPERAFGVDIEHNFQPQYEENKGRGKNLSELKATAKAANEIYLASDPDREGEAIAWHLKEVLGKINRKAPFRRVTFNQITKSAIEKAFEDPGDINMALVDSQQARRVLDRIVGYQISPLLWTRIERGVSAGRVQSVALRLVCEREREILSFIPKEYWNFVAEFNTDSNKDAFRAKLAKINGEKFEVNNKTDADELLRKVQAVPAWHVSDVTTAPRRKFAYPPFITSTLQQAASSSLGFSASQTMRIAQQLYEGVDVGSGSIGLITYMRTDSVAVAPEAQNSCRAFIAAEYGSEYVPTAFNVYKSKGNAQEAHEAIRPTDINLTPEKLRNFLDPQQLRLYTLIWRRFVASQMAPANLERT